MMQMFGLGLRSPVAKGNAEDPNPSTPARPATSPVPGAPRPVRLVYCDDKGRFKMDPEAALSLHRVKGPLGVVSVCGRSRQGKSFILNQLLGRTSGFEVAPTHRPCTKGLWMWSAPLRRTAIDGTEYNLLLLDSEGIDAYDQTGTYSIQIFTLAVLLSSMFIYNQMGGIDEAALDRLSLVTEMSKHIRVRASQSQSTAADIGQFSPIFVWLLRDFYLDLMEEDQKITPREYLELALKPMQGSKKDVAARNQIRESIRSLFPDRECFTLVRPVNNERDLQRLDQTCIEKLRPEFRAGLDALTKFVFERTRPKQVGSTVMTGPILAGLTQAFLDALNTGAVPIIATSWQNVEEAECRRAYDLSIEKYNHVFDKSKLPEEAILQEAHEVALRKALAVFNSSAVGAGATRQNYQNLFQANVKKCFEDYKRNAFMEADRKCTEAIQTMDNKLRNACNIPDTSLDEVLQDFGSLLSEYDRSACGPGKWRKLASFLCQSLEGPILDLTKRMQYKSGAEISALKLKCHSVEDKLALLGKQLEVSERNEQDYRKRYEDAVSDKKNISDEYASHLASIQGKYSSLEEKYGNVSQLLEAAKEESFQWTKKYDLLVSKHKVEKQQMDVEIASIKTRCSSAESRLGAAHEQVESTREEAAQWRRKHDLAVKEAQTTVINITALKDQAIKQAQLKEDSLRSEFLATIAEKENKIRDSMALLEETQHHLYGLNLQLKNQETELRSQETEFITLKGEAKDLKEKLDVAKAKIESSDREIQSLEHEKSHLEQMLEMKHRRLEEIEEKYRIAEMDAKQATEAAKEARKEVVKLEDEKSDLHKLATERLDALEEASKKAETFEKEKAGLLQEAENIRNSQREAVSNVSCLEAKVRERKQEMEELMQSMTEQKASAVQGLENLLASERAARADADLRAEALSLQLQSTQVNLDALQQELTAVQLNETTADNRLRSISRTKRERSEESAGVELVTDMDAEVENTKQRKRSRRRTTESGNAHVALMPAESDSVANPDDDSSDRRDTQDYLKLTVVKLKQELTKHGYGAELLQLRNPTKKDILALYEKLVLKK